MNFFARIFNRFVVIVFAYTGFMICPKISLLSRYVHFFFFIDFSCYLFVGFLGSVYKFFGERGSSI